jgi:hypothetical protein
MTEVKNRAAEKGWPIHEWCFRETSAEPFGWLLQSEIERKKREVTTRMWLNEYELQEPSPESRAIDPNKVDAMFIKAIGNYAGSPREYIETEKPVEGGEYATGTDWARKVDWTVIVTLRTDCNPFRVVAFERTAREPWPVMVKKFEERLKRYPGEAAHDGTGVGDVVAGYMEEDAIAFIMVGRARSDLLSNYINGVENGEILSPFIRFMEREHKYASVDDLYGTGHLPDSFAAMALAYYAATVPRGVGML